MGLVVLHDVVEVVQSLHLLVLQHVQQVAVPVGVQQQRLHLDGSGHSQHTTVSTQQSARNGQHATVSTQQSARNSQHVTVST